MSFLLQSRLAGDSAIQLRAIACAALERIPEPDAWVSSRGFQLSAQPGWVDAYINSNAQLPGEDEDAITDDMILAAVRVLRAEELAAVQSLNSEENADG